MISFPVVHQICLVRFGFPPFGFIAVKGVIVCPKQPLEFFQDLVIFLATEILFSISVIPAIKKRINRKLSPMKPITPVFVLRVDTLRNKYGKYFIIGVVRVCN
jgi:hypothetical protein